MAVVGSPPTTPIPPPPVLDNRLPFSSLGAPQPPGIVGGGVFPIPQAGFVLKTPVRLTSESGSPAGSLFSPTSPIQDNSSQWNGGSGFQSESEGAGGSSQ
jgi:hypothetical protein